jgi:hypothetical protein
MDQKFEGTPKATLRVEGRTVIRTAVTNDWGSQLLWQVTRGGEPVASANARLGESYSLADVAPGQYEIVLQIFRYENYAKDAAGKYTVSKFVDVSDKVTVTI